MKLACCRVTRVLATVFIWKAFCLKHPLIQRGTLFMRRLVLLSFICFSIVASILAEAGGSGRGKSDDHDDNGPIQSGYAVVTSSSTTGMVVFETFGLKKGQETTQAGVLPPDMTTNAVMFVDSNGKLSRNLGVAVVNPSSSKATVTLTLRKEDGAVLGTTTLDVPAHEQTSRFVTELFSSQSVPSDVTGMLSITSATPVAVIGLRFRGANFSTLPVTNLSTSSAVPTIATGVGGAGAVLLPQFASGGGWATEIVIANTGAASMTVRVDLFKSDGTALTATLNGESASSFTNITVPAGGVKVLAPRNSNGDTDF
jgi:hypothetical protein